jgi:hypothetical protein
MFFVEDTRHGTTYLVFTWQDPRLDGFQGNVTEDVRLDYDMETVHQWHDGESPPEPCVGRSLRDASHFKVFRSISELTAAGFERVPGDPVVFGRWSEYTRLRLEPPDPDETNDEQWYSYLDKLDEDARRRRRASTISPPATGSTRDEIAAWLARKHLVVDNAIREVWYLPHGAPPDEIRLLECNDRLAGSESETDAIDFSLNIEGANYRLFVADITSDQLEQIRRDPSRLPPNWSLNGRMIWRRGA